MDFTADSPLSRAAHELSPRADELIHDVEQCLRREVPELWDEPDIAQMTAENVAEHVIALLFGIEHGIEPRLIDPPAADAERARRLAERGRPVTAMLRSFPLAHGRVVDRLLEELPRLTSDAESINVAARKLIALSHAYMDRTSVTGVLAFQEERDRRVQWRLSVVNEASARVGTTLDIAVPPRSWRTWPPSDSPTPSASTSSTRLPETTLPRRAHSWSAGSPSGR